MKIIVSIILLFNACIATSQAGLVGSWTGAVTRDGAVQPLELFISVSNGDTVATYDLPAMGMYHEPVKQLLVSGMSITFRVFMGEFKCIIHPEYNEITGTNLAWKPVALKLHLRKTFALPLTYRTEETGVPVGKETIRGTLYLPLTKSRHPLVIIAHGAQDPTRNNWVYRYFAYMLPQYGYAVYIFDQHTYNTNGSTRTMHQHAADIVAIARQLGKHHRIDKKKIGLIGTSRGGWVATIAGATPGVFKTIIQLAGPSLSPVSLEYEVVRASLTSEGYTTIQVDSALAYTDLYFKSIADTNLNQELLDTYRHLQNRPWATVLQQPVEGLDEGRLWWKENDFNASDYLSRSTASVLAIFGSADILVPPATNIPLMRSSLTASGKKFTILTIEGLPHGLYHYQSLHTGAFQWPVGYWVWPKRSVVLDEAVVKWLDENL